ncbi:hypothetical protein L1987_17194 [Smallanthus sonchifolius]|uniref:Uncharacterized protein n=1 Tax=Smallanthus sonchifolius TaxID=185202 RepID=A0ACB9IW42_9ASTR|nr:hypothetical protein L1987_17194 [Smallanthus sonchifolius]
MVTTSPGFRSPPPPPSTYKSYFHTITFTISSSFWILSYFYFYTDVFIQKIGAVDRTSNRKPEFLQYIIFSRDRGRKFVILSFY